MEQLFGLCGFFPIHPMSYVTAQRNRKSIAEKAANAAKEAENAASSEPVVESSG